MSDRRYPMLAPLISLDILRTRAVVRHPALGSWIGLGLPLILAVAALSAGGAAAAPDVSTAYGAAMLGLLIGAPVSFFAYTVLFRGGDDGFLRRLGISPRALFAERAGRLLGLSLGLLLLLLVPFLSSHQSLSRPLAAGLAAAFASWGFGVATLSLAARMLSLPPTENRMGCLAIGMKWDPQLKSVAPLVYAPIPPLLAGAVAGALVGAVPGAGWAVTLPVILVAVLIAFAARPAFAHALPRFAPQALEMSFAPAPGGGGAELRAGRGIGRLLPRRAALAWVRDSLVAGRRFAWATRVVWPVALVSVIALARWGRDPSTRTWVGAVAVGVWLAQAVAIVGMGRLERGGRRWIDRSLGIFPAERLLGRWAWGWGLALWLGVPLAFAWSVWAEAGPGWPWLLVGGGTAAIAALASVAAAGWK